MSIFRKVSKLLFVVVCIAFLLPNTAYAYIDPGTGSLIFQAIVAGVLGVGVAFKMSYGRIKGVFSKKKDDNSEK